MLEKEVKFLLEELPSSLGSPTLVSQYYLVTKPFEVRVRESNKHFVTLKSLSKSGIRIELETVIPVLLYRMLKKLAKTGIKKKRFLVSVDGNLWEIDQYHDGLVIAECEYKTKPPICPWAGKDVTKDKNYFNSNLAKRL